MVETYQGTLIDLNIGDKGSYIYINFGAPRSMKTTTRVRPRLRWRWHAARSTWTSSSRCRSG
ncbi:MAG: hypothetical protein R3A10_13625 [Caldilineaceae bacterium]